MTTFKSFEEAKEYAEFKLEMIGERILVMKKGKKFLVTSDYKAAKDEGFELVVGLYNF